MFSKNFWFTFLESKCIEMKVVVENIINELYGSEIQNLGSDIEIIALSPENHEDPAWDEVSDIDALFLSYQFLFAVRDHKHLFEPMLNLAKKSNLFKADIQGWMTLFCNQF